MKKLLALICGLFFTCSLTACEGLTNLPFLGGSDTQSETVSNEDTGSSEKDSQSTQDPAQHTHKMKKTSGKAATCDAEGNIDYWYCDGCDVYYSDAQGAKEISLEETVLGKKSHEGTLIQGVNPTCSSNGKLSYYDCKNCTKIFEDEDCTKELTYGQLMLAKEPHDMVYHAAIPVVGLENGMKEYWTCNTCERYFGDELGKTTVDKDKLVEYSVMGIPDFLVEVPAGRDPVVLQLTDTQIIYAENARDGRDGVLSSWKKQYKDERCYNYLRETIETVNPDLIILTGDLVYGEFDDNGEAFTYFVEFMDSFQKPWAPIFGNHENESKMGVDWQCEQFEKATYCKFEQKELTGNGNYSVGIVQGGEIKRVFYMLDSNGCGNASEESLANGHTVKSAGFQWDQVEWYTEQITLLKEYSPDTKISFAYHIQSAIFEDAYAKYGFSQADGDPDIHIDLLPDKAEGDFGYIGAPLKGEWDSTYSIFNGMKALGVDSIFVGHEHCNSASVVYDGIRFQYGQKSTEYDRFNYVLPNGQIQGEYGKPDGAISLIGGSVIVLSEEDGAIKDAYIYYCENAGGNIDWSQFQTIEVNGLSYSGTEGNVLVEAVEFNGVNAYKVTATEQGKVKMDPSKLKGKTTFTFSVYVPSGFARLGGLGPFAIRLKPDGAAAAAVPNAVALEGKYYIDYDVDTTEVTKLTADTWVTFTVDITSIANTCDEFAFVVATGNTIYLKDMAVS